MEAVIQDPSLVIMMGIAGSGKSTFALKHFVSTGVLSSDFFRAMICDNPEDQSVSADAFRLLEQAVRARLSLGRLTVIDATNIQKASRINFISLGRKFHIPRVAILLDMPREICIRRDRERKRTVGEDVILRQHRQLQDALKEIRNEGFNQIIHLENPRQADELIITLNPPPCRREWDEGPFDIIGDVHGCYLELMELLEKLGWNVTPDGDATPPPGRKAVFIGDMVDRGPRIVPVLKTVMKLHREGHCLCLLGNHDWKLLRALRGNKVQVKHGLENSIGQLQNEGPEFLKELEEFLQGLPTHYMLDEGRLAVAHGGIPENMQGRDSRRVRVFTLYGDVTGRTDSHGMPIRGDWASRYQGKAMVVYGHVAVKRACWHNNTLDIDTGCVYGGQLTALKYPEMELLSVKARQVYYPRPTPLQDPQGCP